MINTADDFFYILLNLSDDQRDSVYVKNKERLPQLIETAKEFTWENTAKKLGEYENSKNRGNKDITHNVDIELLNNFKQEITDKFKNTTDPICNNVDGWEKETEIYINN